MPCNIQLRKLSLECWVNVNGGWHHITNGSHGVDLGVINDPILGQSGCGLGVMNDSIFGRCEVS